MVHTSAKKLHYFHEIAIGTRIQGWIYWGVGTGGCTLLALVRGGAGGAIFHDKAKNIRDKVRYCNLSNNMMIISKQLQFKYNSQARFCSSQAS
jgi:hypothetical protein